MTSNYDNNKHFKEIIYKKFYEYIDNKYGFNSKVQINLLTNN